MKSNDAFEFKVEMLRHPTDEDWERCKLLALNTMGKKFIEGSEVTQRWRKNILDAGHSPIRTLMFTFRLTLPSYLSVHFVRHKFGVEHYVQSQRNDRQDKYDRRKAPQNVPVSHIMDINAAELIQMSHLRLCGKADEETQMVMQAMCIQVENSNPEFINLLVPNCVYCNSLCHEMQSCNMKALWFNSI